MKGYDNKHELVTSSTIQKVRIFYAWNVAVKTIGIVFVHTHIINRVDNTRLEYLEKGMRAKERGEIARKLFGNPDLLALDHVEVCKNFSK